MEAAAGYRDHVRPTASRSQRVLPRAVGGGGELPLHEFVMRSLACRSPLSLRLYSLPFRFSAAERFVGGIQQLQRLSVEVAGPSGRHQVVVQGGYRGLGQARAEGYFRILEVEFIRQHEIMLPSGA